jgi:hypothetical protein
VDWQSEEGNSELLGTLVGQYSGGGELVELLGSSGVRIRVGELQWLNEDPIGVSLSLAGVNGSLIVAKALSRRDIEGKVSLAFGSLRGSDGRIRQA